MKTQYYTATSLDGFLADRRNSLDWLMQFGDDMTSDYPAFIANVGAIAMDMNDVEQFTVNAGAGIDSVSVADLTGTGQVEAADNVAALRRTG